jgi:hypothetical protein
MAEIEIGQMSDHDLLVVAVTKINGLDIKISEFCSKVESQGHDLEILQAEHRLRTQQADCSAPKPTSKKTISITAGIGSIIGAAVIAIVDHFISRG